MNPYLGMEEDSLAKATAQLAKADLALLKAIYPTRGLIQTSINLFLHSVVSELRERGIEHYSPENEQELIRIIQRRTSIRTLGQADESDVSE